MHPNSLTFCLYPYSLALDRNLIIAIEGCMVLARKNVWGKSYLVGRTWQSLVLPINGL